MIDTHTHILPGIDDGAQDLDQAIRMAKEAKKAGFDEIICTSHYLKHNYELKKENIENIFNNFKQEIIKNDINIELYIGNEVYVDDEITETIREQSFCTINNTKYILIEFPMHHKLQHLDNIIFNIQNLNLIPIVAHPERYSYVQENPNMLIHLIENGVLFQANYGSLVGTYGKNVENTVKILLKNNMIHLLGTDSHNTNIYSKMPEIRAKLEKIIDNKKLELLCETNPKKMISNDDIGFVAPTNYKKSWWF